MIPINARNKVILFYGMFEDNQKYAYVPWSVIYLASCLRTNGFEPIIIDEFCFRDYEQMIKLHADDALLFGVSAMTGRQISEGLKSIEVFRKYNKGAKIAWGGAHATALPEETSKHELIDHVFAGQSFVSLISFLKNLQAGNTQQEKKVIYSEYPTKEQMEQFPDFQLFRYNLNPYINSKTRLLNYSASIGCPGACSFCSWGKGLHTHLYLSMQRILDDFEYLIKTYDLTTILIQDATFFLDKEFVMAFAREKIRRGIDCFWRADSRVIELARFSKEDFKLLANSGLDWLFIGIENTVPRIMKSFRKIYPLEMVDQAIEKVKDFDITLYMSLIVGTPEETIDELKMNKENVNRWGAMSEKVYCQKCIFTPYPGTPSTDLAIEHGFDAPQTLEGWAKHPLFIDTLRAVQSGRTWLNDEYLANFSEILEEITPGRDRNNTIKPAGTKLVKYD